MTDKLAASAIDPQLRTTFRFMPGLPIGNPVVLALLQAAQRPIFAPRVPAHMKHRYVSLGKGCGVHSYRPEGSATRPGIFWIHGGGFVIGSAAQDHGRCFQLAHDLDSVVFSIEYRPSPGGRFPGALDDAHTAWVWIMEHAFEYGLDPSRVAVAGQSAGGGLAASLVQRLHDEGGTQPVAQWLFCPMLDDRTAANGALDAVRHFLWNNRSNRIGWSSYLGTEPGSAVAPQYAVPARRQDLTALPPAWIGVGDIDLFYDEDRRYAAALMAAGVATVFDAVPGAPHAFESLCSRTEIAQEYLARAKSWLADRLGSSSQQISGARRAA